VAEDNRLKIFSGYYIRIMKVTTLVLLWVVVNAEQKVSIMERHKSGLVFEQLPDLTFAKDHWTWVITVRHNLSEYNIEDLIQRVEVLYNTSPRSRQEFWTDSRKKYKEVVRRLLMAKLEVDRLNWHYFENKDTLTQSEIINFNNVAKESPTAVVIKEKYVVIQQSSLNSPKIRVVELLMDIENKLKQLEGFHDEDEITALRIYSEILDEFMEKMDSLTQHLKMRAGKLHRMLETLKNGVVIQDLMCNYDFEETIEKLREIKPLLWFPFNIEFKEVIRLRQFIKIKVGVYGQSAYISLEMPIISSDRANLYRMIPIPVAQNLFSEGSGTASIQPVSKYLAVRNESSTYFNEIDLAECVTGEVTVCPVKHFAFRQQDRCEVDLLNINNTSRLRNCDIRYKNKFEIYFRYSEVGNCWIFSTAKEEKASLKCDSGKVMETTIHGVGIMKIPNDCVLRRGSEVFRNPKSVEEKNSIATDKLIFPQLDLEIAKVADELNDKVTREIFKELIKDTHAESLNLLLGQLKILVNHRKSVYEMYWYLEIFAIIVGIVAIIAIGIFCLVGFLTYIVHEDPNEIELSLITRESDGAIVGAEAPGKAIIRFR